MPLTNNAGLRLGLYLLLLCALYPARLQAQGFPGDLLDLILTQKDSQDTRYVKSFERKFSPRLQLERRVISFGFSPGGNRKQKLYYPNSTANIGLGLYYGNLGFAVTYSLGNESDVRVRNLGKTRYFDLAFNSYQVRFGVDLYLQNYRGFYQSAPRGLLSPSPRRDEPFPQRRDINYFNIGANFYSIRDPMHFSFQAPFLQIKKQLQSAGSLLWLAGVNYNAIAGDSIIYSTPLRGDTLPEKVFVTGKFLSTTLLPGYAYTYVYQEDLYATAAVFAGPGLQAQYVRNQRYGALNLSPYVKFNLRAAFGYNGNRLFGAFIFMTDFNRNIMEGVLMRQSNILYHVQGGVRF